MIALAVVFATLGGGFSQPVNAGGFEQPVRIAHTPAALLNPIYRFERIDLEDGLSQNAVLAMLQDSRGYLWVGTQAGLNRYDGYGFTILEHDSEDPNSLSHSSIISLAEDRNGILWIGTWGGGLNRYDPSSGIFTRYRHNPNNPDSLSDDTVPDLLIDREGVLWVATLGGLDRFEPVTGTFEHFRNDPDKLTSLSSNAVSTIFEDTHGRLWVGTGAFGFPGAGLNLFDRASGFFTRYRHDPTNSNSLLSDNIADLLEDDGGNLWIATGGFNLPGAGLNRFDPASGRFIRFTNNPVDTGSLTSNDVLSLAWDNTGALWVGTWGGGINILHAARPGIAIPNRARFEHLRNDPFNSESLSNDTVWKLLTDRSGLVWAGTINGGLNKFNPHKAQFRLYRNLPSDPNSLGYNVVSGFSEDQNGNIWVTTWGGGLDRFDPQTGVFEHYRNDPNNLNSLSADTVNLAYGTDDGLWVGTFSGLDLLNPKSGKFTHYLQEQPDSPDVGGATIFALMEAVDSRHLWVGTWNGLALFDPRRGEVVARYLPDPDDPNSFGHSQVLHILRDRKGDLWIGAWGGGLNHLPAAEEARALAGEKPKFNRYVLEQAGAESQSENSIYVIHEDRRGQLWLGTTSGLHRFDRETGMSKIYGKKDGLPDDAAYGILEDDLGRLWLSTFRGLARFDPITDQVKVYDVGDGLQSSEFNSGAFMRSSQGTFYFGGVAGFNTFDPMVIEENPHPPPVVLTQVSVFNEPVITDLSGETPLELSYRQNFIAFEFAALDFHAPRKNQYAYMLEGVDPDWVDAGSRRYASYTNLRGGDYVFRVRAANNDGVWNETGVTLPLHVTPPFWETVWFRVLATVTIFGIIAGGYRLRLRAIQIQKRDLEAQVARRTAELRREIESRRQAEAALAEKAAEEAVVAERNRLARDLHDAVTQTLFSASLIAEVLPQLWRTNRGEAERTTDELRQLTRGALAEMRTLLLELRPAALTQTRLDDLLRQLCEALIGRSRLPIELELEGQRRLPPDVQVALYRIAQEALNNVFKYARASEIRVSLDQGPLGVRLAVCDNGAGFNPGNVPADHHGLRIMQERAAGIGADLTIRSSLGEGTQVEVTWIDPEAGEQLEK